MRNQFICLALAVALLEACAHGQSVMDTVYTPPGYEDGPLHATVYIPEVSNGVGVVLTHGRGAIGADMSMWCDTLAAHGYVAATIEYYDFSTNSQYTTYPKPIRAFKTAVQFLRRNAARFKITTGRIVGLGQSEGAMHWGESIIWDNDYAFFQTDSTISDHLDAAVLLYGIYDNFYVQPSLLNVDSILTAFFSPNPDLQWTKGDPIVNVANITTPVLLFHGTADPFVGYEQSVEFRDTLLAYGKTCQLVLGNWGHAFDVQYSGLQPIFTAAGLLAKDTTLAFLGRTIVTDVRPTPLNRLPQKTVLEQNYPNPFNPTSSIRYQIPDIRYVNLVVFDILGRAVATLVNERKESGTYTVKFDASGLSSGIYFYRLNAGSFVETRKMMVIK